MQFLKSLNSRARENDLFWEDHQLDSLIPEEEETHVCFSDLSSNGASLMARKESVDWILTVKAHYRFSAVVVVLAMNISRRSVSSSSSPSSSFGLFCNSSNTKKHFGDAVVFDTTHCLTVFDMPLGIWVGMNNYGENLENEPRIMELRNQEKLHELERQKEEMLRFGSPASLLQRLQDAMNKTDEESENLHKQLLDREIELDPFVQIYKKLRTT
ncbi:hypothetical protein FEM48_Zijuj04G0155800 [Ziziphus jujuba var. spinosa]|uniref:VPS37 C-terminal domain-containing protein n=1 Tax=Ziziphus jujuba var. spinosa TaxID=714518 RepID=A0A978VKP7_ZIZJJ|nr:hypothetical protein FEM48_Zijuj04G0155800 [Ziziphus jujuba var. spinosa]